MRSELLCERVRTFTGDSDSDGLDSNVRLIRRAMLAGVLRMSDSALTFEALGVSLVSVLDVCRSSKAFAHESGCVSSR